MKIPAVYKKGNRTYIYQEQVNDYQCRYKEKKFGWYECFQISELVKLPNLKKGNNIRV